jgi:hypothetical protein
VLLAKLGKWRRKRVKAEEAEEREAMMKSVAVTAEPLFPTLEKFQQEREREMTSVNVHERKKM